MSENRELKPQRGLDGEKSRILESEKGSRNKEESNQKTAQSTASREPTVTKRARVTVTHENESMTSHYCLFGDESGAHNCQTREELSKITT